MLTPFHFGTPQKVDPPHFCPYIFLPQHLFDPKTFVSPQKMFLDPRNYFWTPHEIVHKFVDPQKFCSDIFLTNQQKSNVLFLHFLTTQNCSAKFVWPQNVCPTHLLTPPTKFEFFVFLTWFKNWLILYYFLGWGGVNNIFFGFIFYLVG